MAVCNPDASPMYTLIDDPAKVANAKQKSDDATLASLVINGLIEALSRDVKALQAGLDAKSSSMIEVVASKLSEQRIEILDKVIFHVSPCSIGSYSIASFDRLRTRVCS